MDMQTTLDTLSAMRRQEDVGYKTNDWTRLHPDSSSLSQSDSSSTSNKNYPQHWDCTAVDLGCRNQMAAWCYQVVDVCQLGHESVEITMSLLDRYLCTPQGVAARSDRWAFQLACMASLYTAVKIHEPQAMTPNLIARLSNGAYTAQDIERMEVELLEALKWRVNPPTSNAFSRHLMDLVPPDVVDKHMKYVVLDLTFLQTELAIANSLFVTAKASTVAYAALLNSLESLGLDHTVLQQVGIFLAQSLQLDAASVLTMQTVLYKTLAQQRSAACPPAVHSKVRRMSLKAPGPAATGEVSPRAVVYSQ